MFGLGTTGTILVDVLSCGRENFLNELQEASRVKRWVNRRYGYRVKLKGLVCMLDLLAHVILLQYVDDSQVQDNIIDLMERWFPLSRFTFCSGRHVDPELNLKPAKMEVNLIKATRETNQDMADMGNKMASFLIILYVSV